MNMAISAQIATLPLLIVLATLLRLRFAGRSSAARPHPLALPRASPAFPGCPRAITRDHITPEPRCGGLIRSCRTLLTGPAGGAWGPAGRARSRRTRRRSSSSRVWSGPRVSSVSATPVSRTCRGIASRRCSSASRFAPASATRARSSASAPGRSATRVNTRTRLPCSVSRRRRMADSRPLSRFPPETIATVRPAVGARRPLGEGGQGDGSGALGDELGALRQQHDRARDLVLLDGDHPIQEVLQQRLGEATGMLDRDPVGDRGAGRGDRLGPGAVGAQQAGVGSTGGRLHADQLHARARAAQGGADPARQAASADRDHHAGELRNVPEQLQSDRALAGDHVEVVEGMDQRRPVGAAGTRLRGPLPGQGQGVVDRLARQRHAGTEPLHGLDLGNGGFAGHEHLAGDPVPEGRLGDGAAVVARAGGDEPGRGPGPESGHLREGSPDLERARPLQALALQGQRSAGERGELVGEDRGRVAARVRRRQRSRDRGRSRRSAAARSHSP